MKHRKKYRYINTTWETWDYDVWGNAKDGYQVNNRFNIDRCLPIKLRVQVANEGTPQQFEHASPTDKDIREALSLRRIQIETEGDDLSIYVSASRDSYPCGELHCTSHESLSPIRENKRVPENETIVKNKDGSETVIQWEE